MIRTARTLSLTLFWLGTFEFGTMATDSAAQDSELYDLSLNELSSLKVSTASRSLESLEQAPATIYVVTEADIRRYGYSTLEEILVNTPGVQIIHPDFFAVGGQRGFLGNFSQTLLLLNGREMQNLIAAEAFISDQFATHNIARVEILNGPGSALYGANALVGVINIITINDDPLFEGAAINVEAGTENTRAASTYFGKTFGSLRLSGSVRRSASDGWDFSDEVADPKHFSDGSSPIVQQASTANADSYENRRDARPYSLKVEWNGFYAGRDAYTLKSGKGLENVALRYDLQKDERHFRLDYVGWQHDVEEGLRIKIENQHYNEWFWGRNNNFDSEIFDAAVADGRDPDVPLTLDEIHDDYTLIYSQRHSGGSTLDRTLAEAQIDLQNHVEAIVGVEYTEKDIFGVAIAQEDVFPPFDTRLSEENALHRPVYQTNSDSLYLQLKAPLSDMLALTLGSRWDRASFYGTINTLRSGLVWAYSADTIFKLLYGEAFREPTIFESGPSPDTAKQLNPTRIATWELGAAHDFSEHWRAQSTFFKSQAKDLIVAGSTVDFVNSPHDINNVGVENMLQLQYGVWRGDMAYTYIDPEDLRVEQQNVDALNVYQHHINLGVAYALTDIWTLAMRANHFSAVDAEHGNSGVNEVITIDSATTLDLTASFEIGIGKQQLFDGYIALKNALDEEWYHPNVRNTGPREYDQPGRTLLTRFNFNF